MAIKFRKRATRTPYQQEQYEKLCLLIGRHAGFHYKRKRDGACLFRWHGVEDRYGDAGTGAFFDYLEEQGTKFVVETHARSMVATDTGEGWRFLGYMVAPKKRASVCVAIPTAEGGGADVWTTPRPWVTGGRTPRQYVEKAN